MDDREVEDVARGREIDPLELELVGMAGVGDVLLFGREAAAANVGVDVDRVAGTERTLRRAGAGCGPKANGEDALARREHETGALAPDHDRADAGVLRLAERP